MIYGLASRYDPVKDYSQPGFAAYESPVATRTDRLAELARPRVWTKARSANWHDYVLLSPDRQHLYVSFIRPQRGMDMNEGTFWVIDASTGWRIVELKLHASAPLSVSPDGARLYTISQGNGLG